MFIFMFWFFFYFFVVLSVNYPKSVIDENNSNTFPFSIWMSAFHQQQKNIANGIKRKKKNAQSLQLKFSREKKKLN